jgi:hypothetical protein
MLALQTEKRDTAKPFFKGALNRLRNVQEQAKSLGKGTRILRQSISSHANR